MNKYLPKELEALICEYKHSAEMYDIAQEYKRWFFQDIYDRSMNLFKMTAFNYRTAGGSYIYIYSIFQSYTNLPSAILCPRLLNEYGARGKPSASVVEDYPWRREYIDYFHL